MTSRILKALSLCDKAGSFSTLQSAFHEHVGSVIHEVLTQPLQKPLRDDISPSQSCPAAQQLRDEIDSLPAADDIWYFLFHVGGKLLQSWKSKRQRGGDSAGALAENVAANAFVLFAGRKIPSIEAVKLRWNFLATERIAFEKTSDYINANSAEKRKLHLQTVLAIFSERAHKHLFTVFWSSFLCRSTPSTLNIHLLSCLAADILPNLTNPLALSDYLSGCFAAGGLVAVLSLQGIFILMLDQGLEYPMFYQQLYSLMTPSGFSSRYRYTLFRLVNVCLTSPHIPAYITAAFIKRTARVALLSPTPSLYFVLPFLRQLLQRHPNCLSLIHRTTAQATVQASTADATPEEIAAAEKVAKLFDGIDPFLPEEPCLEKCNAVSSTLWELAILEKHYIPAVPLMVSAFASPAEDNTPLRFDKTYARLFTSEVTREVSSRRVPSISLSLPTELGVEGIVQVV